MYRNLLARYLRLFHRLLFRLLHESSRLSALCSHRAYLPLASPALHQYPVPNFSRTDAQDSMPSVFNAKPTTTTTNPFREEPSAMTSARRLRALVCVVIVTLARARPGPASRNRRAADAISAQQKTLLVDAHNTLRALEGASGMEALVRI